MAGDVAGIAGGGAGADRRVSLGLGYGKGAHEVAAFCKGAGAAGAADVHASVAVFCRRAAGGGGGAVLEMSTSRGRDRRGPEAPTSAVAIHAGKIISKIAHEPAKARVRVATRALCLRVQPQ